MIDYEKLRIVHELAEKWHRKTSYDIYISIGHRVEVVGMNFIYYILETFCDRNKENVKESYYSIDDLIDKLTKINNSEMKYKIGDTVWHLNDEKYYSIIRLERQNKEAGVNAKKCQHETDGTITALLVNPIIYMFKCKKCGETYK